MMFRTESAKTLSARYPQVFYKSPLSRAISWSCVVAAVALFVYGCWHVGFSLSVVTEGIDRLGWFVVLMVPPSPGTHFWIYLQALGETLSIALLGTILAAVIALPISLLASRNVIPFTLIRFPVRRILDSMRGIDTLIWALVWINVVGLGPFAGVLAIACSDFGALGKLFSEVIEMAEKKQVEGVCSTGGSRLHEVRFGLIPQVLPVIAGQILYYIESNTRSATIIGIVGAGGIGSQLAEQIRILEWQNVAFLILMILVAVTAIDFVSSRLRFAIIGKQAVTS